MEPQWDENVERYYFVDRNFNPNYRIYGQYNLVINEFFIEDDLYISFLENEDRDTQEYNRYWQRKMDKFNLWNDIIINHPSFTCIFDKLTDIPEHILDDILEFAKFRFVNEYGPKSSDFEDILNHENYIIYLSNKIYGSYDNFFDNDQEHIYISIVLSNP